MNRYKGILRLAVLLALLTALSVSAAAAQEDGWKEADGYWCYILDGELCRDGIYEIEGKKYAFNWEGHLAVDQVICLYDPATQAYQYYRTREDGTLYEKQWYVETVDEWNSYRYYYGENGVAPVGPTQVEGVLYIFGDAGLMYAGQTYSDGVDHYITDQDGHAAKLGNNAWTFLNGNYYYVQEGQLCREGVYKIGQAWYAFGWDGTMVNDEVYGICEAESGEEFLYRAKPGGSLYVESWYRDVDGQWYYYGSGGKAAKGVQKVGATMYIFDANGRMRTDEIYTTGGQSYAAGPSGAAGLLSSNAWSWIDGAYYYVLGTQVLCDGIYKIGGQYYAFSDTGRMIASDRGCLYSQELGRAIEFRANASGALYVNGWYQDAYGYWYFYGAAGEAASGMRQLGGWWYGFADDGKMLTNQAFQGYILDANGIGTAMANNAWTYYGGRYYYRQNGQLCTWGIYQIGNAWYGFDQEGRMYADTTISFGAEHIYRAQASGALCRSQWYLASDGSWYYYDENGRGVNGVVRVGSADYGFALGLMVTDGIVYDEDGYCYSTNANGIVNRNTGWQTCGGSWVYVTDDSGRLDTGWREGPDGQQVCLQPEMLHDTIASVDGKLYVFDAGGHGTAYTGTGFYGRQYVQDGEIVKSQWKKLDGAWYYFDAEGQYCTGWYCVAEVPYLFGYDGKMLSGGWGEFYGIRAYAEESGRLKVGVHSIDGVLYSFDHDGWLMTDTAVYHEDQQYWAESDGRLQLRQTEDARNGWLQHADGGWSYYLDGCQVRQEMLCIGGSWYGFDGDGRMVANAIYNEMYFGPSGAARSGWILHHGKWMYADPQNGMRLTEGSRILGGVEYIFEDYHAKVGTFVYNDRIVTTNADGAVISRLSFADGWSYVEGNVCYFRNGTAYTGWVGNYLVLDGVMQRGGIAQYGGKLYFLDNYGLYLRNGWIQLGDAYLYAQENGELCCNEWLRADGTWYYFDDVVMVQQNILIQGVLNRFDANGAWLGAVQTPESGWLQIDGQKYYSHAGQYVLGECCIGGSWYCFDEMGRMVADSFCADHYHGADGVRYAGTGWKTIHGTRYYFGIDGKPAQGWITLGSATYYCGDDGMAVGYVAIDDELYRFGENGVLLEKVQNENGWFYAAGKWYYYENGKLARGYRVINAVGYYFYNEMATSDIVYVDGADRYFGANGAEVTGQGWHVLYNESYGLQLPVYVNACGEALYYGVHIIEGKAYYFDILLGAGG